MYMNRLTNVISCSSRCGHAYMDGWHHTRPTHSSLTSEMYVSDSQAIQITNWLTLQKGRDPS